MTTLITHFCQAVGAKVLNYALSDHIHEMSRNSDFSSLLFSAVAVVIGFFAMVLAGGIFGNLFERKWSKNTWLFACGFWAVMAFTLTFTSSISLFLLVRWFGAKASWLFIVFLALTYNSQSLSPIAWIKGFFRDNRGLVESFVRGFVFFIGLGLSGFVIFLIS